MRVLSFIPAFLLAAASFVAAAPTPADTSCVAAPTSSGDDSALQPVISIITTATTAIQPLSNQLSGLTGDACTTDAVSGIVVQITAVVQTCVTDLQAAAKVDLTGLDLTNLCATISALLELVVCILNTLVGIILTLGITAIVTIQAVICDLLKIVVTLVGCLDIYIDVSVAASLGSICSTVKGLVNICLNVFVGVSL